MNTHELNTKTALIQAAGELFAQHGLEGTSVRAIAEKAGSNIAAVNYHFGSKENLYKETLLYVARYGETYPAVRFWKDETRLQTREGQIEAIRGIVVEKFRVIFAENTPSWFWPLMLRSLLDPSPSLAEVVQNVFKPEHDAITQIVRHIKPEMDEATAHLWGFLLFGAVAIYVFARAPILMLLGRQDYSREFLDSVSDFVSNALLASLDLR